MILSRLFHHPRWWLALFAIFLAAPSLNASEPVIRTLDIRGLRIGGSTTLTIDGDHLGKAPRLLFRLPRRKRSSQEPRPRRQATVRRYPWPTRLSRAITICAW